MSARVRLAMLVLGIGLALAPGALAADDPADGPWHYDAWNRLMSPYCPGRTLLDCPSSQATELRAWIAEQEASGRTRADVEAQLYEQFGDVILQAPRASGFGLAAYVIPAIAVVLGAGLVVVFLRRQAARRGPAPVAVAAAPLDAELERRIDEEMRSG